VAKPQRAESAVDLHSVAHRRGNRCVPRAAIADISVSPVWERSPPWHHSEAFLEQTEAFRPAGEKARARDPLRTRGTASLRMTAKEKERLDLLAAALKR
jgi:hypothetical protein